MRTKVEVESMYKDLKEIEAGIHPSLLLFAQWVLKRRGDAKYFAQDMKGLADASRRNKA